MVNPQLTKNILKGWNKEILIFIISGLLIIFYLIYLKHDSPNSGDAKLKEVQQLSVEIPVFPKFKEAGSNYNSGSKLANVTKYFNSTANYDEVRTFYTTSLLEKGWILSNEDQIGIAGKELTFQRGEFSIIIYYAGDNSNKGYNYAMNFVWRDSKSTTIPPKFIGLR